MPGYAWSCHVCGANVGADLDACPACHAPAELTGAEIDRRRRERTGLPLRPRHVLQPRTMGWIFVGIYAAVIAAILAFIFSPAASDMSGLLLVVPALPWAILGDWLLAGQGLGIGILIGLPLNGVLAYFIGRAIGRRLR